jgi:hypothetical protein
MSDLKLIALDAEDLSVLAAHLQDAVLRVEDMAYLKAERRFAAVVNRFDWDQAAQAKSRPKGFIRRRAGLRVDQVNGAKISGIDLSKKDQVLSLLTLAFEPGDAPRGAIMLAFAGGGGVRLDVDCIEAALTDLGAAWATRRKPEHSENSSS